MRGWRVPLILFVIVVVLAGILSIKILNNTPEKQQQEILDNYNKTKLENDTNTELDFEKIWKSIEKKAQKSALKQGAGLMVIAGLIGGFYVLCNVKIYSKLGIEGLLVKLYVFSVIVSFFLIFTFNETLFDIINAISGIISIILLIIEYKVIGINPWLLLLGLIPLVGSLALVILIIYGECKLAEYFGKGTGFKLGLIFLPIIFIPILAFSAE